MAYTLPNRRVIRPWDLRRNRYIHRRARLVVNSSGAASATVVFPGPGRVIAVQYGILGTNGGDDYGAATSGTLVFKADSLDGAQIWTDGDLSSAQDGPLPVGTVAKDEARGATAATDAFSGGFPIRGGVYVVIASGTEAEVVTVDILVRLCTYVALNMTADSGADGSATATRIVRLGNAGVLAAVALDFQNMPATTDVTIYADDASNGTALFTSTDSATDLAPSLIGRPGADEAINASAATDGTECGNMFKKQLIVKFAQGDAFTSANERIIVELWIDD